MGWGWRCSEDLKWAGLDWSRARLLTWPNSDATHWSKLTRCWASGRRSTSPSRIPLFPAPSERFLPVMEKSYGDRNKFSALHLVMVIPLCRVNEAAYVLPLTPVGPIRPDGGWSIRIMRVRSYRKIHGGKKRGISNPSPCHSAAENNVSWAASLGIISCMPNISQLPGAYGCAGSLLTPVIQHSENKPGMEAGWLMLTACGNPARRPW